MLYDHLAVSKVVLAIWAWARGAPIIAVCGDMVESCERAQPR
eukprot:CAMPEP_0119321806 /NCGR_PEP_ID=MMETSP1333-20130426/56487_1 /TAXON_ID=418940 /ORGANISM="Scyphosphaera apsteinii, Strain RCC1455" /LENGTH=41 /DNA_ID= /DNA_START= /DNA_END= /DNA_ORIENTATION=